MTRSATSATKDKRLTKPFTLKPGETCDLDKIASRVDTDQYDKKSAYKKIAQNAEQIALLTRKLYAEKKRSVLLVLQAMDAAGKDSTVRVVFKGVNPQYFRIACFKKPSSEELAQDFLWRIHKKAPPKGHFGIFNRSHYEDVLVVRVHNLQPEPVWQARYQQINEFENLLSENGIKIIKCYIHISKDEQRERLQARMDDPDAHWKVNLGDLDERALWSDYRAAYNDAITNCNTQWAPWHIIPADRKWYRCLVISELVLNTLREMAPEYPQADQDYRGMKVT